jgi:hypothetical protein
VRNSESPGLSKEQVQLHRVLGVANVLLGVATIVGSVIGSTNYVQLATGILWFLTGVGWLWGIRVGRRRAERSRRETEIRHNETEDLNL